MAKRQLHDSVHGGFTLVELLVVIAIIGTLVGLLLPAVQTARESARRSSCSNKVKQIALAMHGYHSAQDRFPSGCETKQSTTPNCLQGTDATDGGPPWSVRILPLMDDQARYDSYNLTGSFSPVSTITTATNFSKQFKPNPAFKCPSNQLARDTSPHTNYLACSGGGVNADAVCVQRGYFFENGVFFNNSKTKAKDITDGTTYVILLGESRYFPNIDASPYGSWDGAFRFYPGSQSPMGTCGTRDGINTLTYPASNFFYVSGGSTGTFGSTHPGGATFAMADGSVLFLSESISLTLYRRLGQCASGIGKQGYQQ